MKRKIHFYLIPVSIFIGLSMFVFSCKEDEKPPVLVATSVELVSGEDQTGEGENQLENPISVKVKDQDGNVFSGAQVNFSVQEGQVSSPAVISNTNGVAATTWVLGPGIGIQTLMVNVYNADGTAPLIGSPISINATALAGAHSIQVATGAQQYAFVGNPLPNPVYVLVKDNNGDPFEGATVNFSIAEGTLSSASGVSDATGMTSVEWTLGATEGVQILTVTGFKSDGTTALNGSPLSIRANATAVVQGEVLTDFDGNIYKTIEIGDQVWMAENLRTTHYADGTALLLQTTGAAWKAMGYNYNIMACRFIDNDKNNEYGAYYNWGGAMKLRRSSTKNPSGIQGVCPDNWHLPSNAEWDQLAKHLGASPGGKMKEMGTEHWTSPNTGASNESSFTAIGAGILVMPSGGLSGKGLVANFRTTTVGARESESTLRSLRNINEYLTTLKTIDKNSGASVRCVKD